MARTSGRLLAGLFLVLSLASAGRAQGAEQRSWNQPRGNAAGTAVSAVAPIRAEPVEAWRQGFEALLSSPVSWGDVVYVVGEERRERRLCAFDAASGAPRGVARLRKGARAGLAVWQGTVAVCDEGGITTYTHKQDDLKLAKTLAGRFDPQPALHEGRLFLSDGSSLHCIDLATLKVLARSPGGAGRPSIRVLENGELEVATLSVGPVVGYEGDYLRLHLSYTKGLAGKSLQFEGGGYSRMGRVELDSLRRREGYVFPLESEIPYDLLWFLGSPYPQWGSGFGGVLSAGKLVPIARDAVPWRGTVVGFAADGALIRMRNDGAYGELVAAQSLPSGARPGAATRASGVLYLGNWAVDLEGEGRVLWCAPELDTDGPLIPVADGRVVYGSFAGALVGLADPGLTAAAGAPQVEAAQAEAAAPPRPSRPGAGPGVVLADGRRIAGAVERRDGGEVRVAPSGGEPRAFTPAQLALVEDGAGVALVGEEFPVYRAWRAALDADHCARLVQVFEGFLATRHVAECTRALEEARGFGLAPETERRLRGALAGKTETRAANAEAQLIQKKRAEFALREASAADFLAAADWCGAQGLLTAASVLAEDAARTLLDLEGEELVRRGRAWMPADFPWRDGPDAHERWFAWARELLPAGGAFVPAGDPLWRRAASPPWDRPEGGALALRTRHILLFTTEHDPAVLGASLRRGEGTVRALEELLGAPERPAAESGPLDVRIHASREAYLAERTPQGFFADPWSAGFYSPAEKVSRFYVPRSSDASLLGRTLDETVAHELTHHWIDVCWLGRSSAGVRDDQQGYWLVEGFARFLEGQVPELGRGERRFDDVTVHSIDAAAQVEAQGGLLEVGELMALTNAGFRALDDARHYQVRLRHTLQGLLLTERSIFYDESGSLVFFLMNRAGVQARQTLVELLREFYRGRSVPAPWERFGWESAARLDADFRAFLRETRDASPSGR